MAIILHIDTAAEIASVSIANNGILVSSTQNNIPKEHASFLHNAIKNLLSNAALHFNEITAIAVTEGPGSYTGLRVGMAAAKGFAYALHKPFITVGSLTAMAHAAINNNNSKPFNFYCPMIDARRMEVYTALYKPDLTEALSPSAVILNKNFLLTELQSHTVAFFGSGAQKWQTNFNPRNAVFIEDVNIIDSIAAISYKKYLNNNFTELAHSQPLYGKEFYNG